MRTVGVTFHEDTQMGIRDRLRSERSRAGSDCYTLLERRTVDGLSLIHI